MLDATPEAFVIAGTADTQEEEEVAAAPCMHSPLSVTLVARRLFMMELEVAPGRPSSFTITWTVWSCWPDDWDWAVWAPLARSA
jgi:hypothetical protein